MRLIFISVYIALLFFFICCTASADRCDIVAGAAKSNISLIPPPSQGPSEFTFGSLEFAIDMNDKFRITDQLKAKYWFYQGAHYYDNGYYELALSCANTAIERYNRDSNCWTLKGASLYMLGRYSEAIDSCDKAIDLKPTNARAWHTKGIALYSLGRYKEAVRSCNSALEIDPSDTKAWEYRRMACNSLGCQD